MDQFLPLPNHLFPCLAIPLAEFFPEFCLGWWTPPSLDLTKHRQMGWPRVMLQLSSLIPIFKLAMPPLAKDGGNTSLIVVGSVVSVVIRFVVTNFQVDRIRNEPLWKTTLDRQKREALFIVISRNKPTDVNRTDILLRYTGFPHKIVAMTMFSLVNMTYQHLGDEDQKKLLAVFAAFMMGGVGIEGTRHGNLGLDCFFRCLFAVGFIGVLHYLNEAAEIAALL